MTELNTIEKAIADKLKEVKKISYLTKNDYDELIDFNEKVKVIGSKRKVSLSKEFELELGVELLKLERKLTSKENILKGYKEAKVENLKVRSDLPKVGVLQKKPTRTTKIVAATGLTVAALALAASLIVSSLNKKEETKEEIKVVTIVPTKVTLEMSENAIEFKNSIVTAAHEMLDSGINYKKTKLSEDGFSLEEAILEEADKEVYAEIIAKYMLVSNQRSIANSDYSEYLSQNTYSSLELVQNFYNVNNMLKNNLFVTKKDTTFDFTTLYSDVDDASLLNGFVELIAKFNESKDKEEIAKEIKEYVYDNLTSTTGELKYSNEAKGTLNSLLAAYIQMTNSIKLPKDAKLTLEEISQFFTLEEGCEEYSNITSAVSTEESIQAMNIYSEIDTKIEIVKELMEIDEINEHNTINNIIEKAALEIDLSLLVEPVMDMVEQQLEDKGITVNGKIKEVANDSKISDGKEGIIDQSQLDSVGAQTKEQLEQIIESEPIISEKTTLIGGNGESVDPALAVSYAKQGATDRNNSVNNVVNVPELYQPAYTQGWNEADKAIKEIPATSTTNYVDVEDKIEEVKESETTTIDYTGENNVESTTEFVPINESNLEGQNNVESTTEFVPINESNLEIEVKTLTKTNSILELEKLKQSLLNGASILKEVDSDLERAFTK